ncbi:MAG: hypothetical protein KC561_17085, partial [Myxococcales bacterium]|nr:hypothetical protein [Myxococcales bacterium]
VKLWWLPHTGQVQIFTYDRIPAESPKRGRLKRAIQGSVASDLAFRSLLAVGRRWPRTIPSANRLVGSAYFGRYEHIDDSSVVFNVPTVPRHRECEFAVPFHHTTEAMRSLRERISSRGLRVNFIVEVRVVAPDDLFLSPTQGELVSQIGCYMAPSADLADYFEAAQEILLGYGGRPHWGKSFSLDHDTATRCFPGLTRFTECLDTYDPDGLLLNPFTAAVLGRTMGVAKEGDNR